MLNMKIYNERTAWLFTAVLLMCISCNSGNPVKTSDTDSVRAVVKVLLAEGSRTIETKEQTVLEQLQSWLAEVRPTQPPAEQIGAVIPWCEITFFPADRSRHLPTTNRVYAIRDRATSLELLSKEQMQRLLLILKVGDK